LGGIIGESVEMIARVLEATPCGVFELSPDGRSLVLRAGVGWKKRFLGAVASGADTSQINLLSSKGPLVLEDAGRDVRLRRPKLRVEHGVVSGVFVAVAGRDRPFGFVGVFQKSKRRFNVDEIGFLQGVANVLALAVQRARADEEIRDINRDLEQRVSDRTALV